MRKILVLVLLVAAYGGAAASDLQEGDNEVSLRFSFSDVDLGTADDGSDMGSNEETELALTYGWLVTDAHELGLLLAYFKEDIDGGDFPEDDSTFDTTRIGGFYTYNLNIANETLTPYFGAQISTIGGDGGDFYDLQYGAEVGLKVYPFEHGGLSVGLSYSKLKADFPGLDDADGINLGVGLLVKY